MAVSTVGRRHDPMHEQTGYQQRGVLNYYYFSVVVLSLLLFHFNISQCYGFMAANIKCGSQIKSESFRMQLSNDKRSAFEHTNNPIDDDGEEDDEEADDDDISLDGEIGCSRRRAGIILSSSLAAPLLVGCTRAPVASASVEEETATAAGAATIAESVVNYDCLRDLPPIPRDSVRIYLCRHGQTENNRLRKVQGARVDPPINDNGTRQATNLGIALSRVNNPSPEIVVHSTLLRAKMTAEIAAKQINHDSVYATTKELHFLREVDFGPVAEGQPVALAKAGMKLTYGAWALGNIDYRPKLGGDSGREVRCIYFNNMLIRNGYLIDHHQFLDNTILPPQICHVNTRSNWLPC